MTRTWRASAALAMVMLVSTATPARSQTADPAAGEEPAIPASVTAGAVGRSAIRLTWPAVSGAASYDIYARNTATGVVTGPIPAAGTMGEVGGLVLGRQYEPGVRARSADGAVSDIRWGTAAVYALPNWPPTAVTNLRAQATTTSTRVTVTWTNPPDAVEADTYLIGVTSPEGILIGSYATCDFPCSSRTVDGLEPGPYRVRVAPVSWSGGTGQWAFTSALVNVVDGCADGGACLSVDADSDEGDAELRAQGINSSLWDVDPELLRPLKVQNLRWSAPWTYDLAEDLGARMTWVLSNSWHQRGMLADGAVPRPWADWETYEQWTYGTALGLSRQRPIVDWIDIQNEPYIGYFPGELNPYYTPGQLSEHMDRATEAIRLGDPDVGVVGPSVSSYTDSQFRTFLDYAVLLNTRLDALNWHELSPAGGSVDRIPTDIVEHVANVRSMLAARPSLGDPEIHVNEYTSFTTGHLAGWGVGFIAALEKADVDLAMRSCGDPNTNCGGGAELIDADGATLAPYWVHRYYADQTGTRLETATTNANVTGFATRDDDDVRVMVGRHNTCVAAVNPLCTNSALVTGPAYDVPLRVTGLDAGAERRVVIQRIPATTAPVEAPTPVSNQVLTVAADGSLAITLPTVADGEALTVTIGPRSTVTPDPDPGPPNPPDATGAGPL